MSSEQYVYEIYKEQSFSSAAKKLFISQPALSASVRKLEQTLQIQIFDRACSPVTLTEQGKVYIESLEKIFKIEDEMRERLSDISHLKTGHVIVSGANFVSSFILPSVIMRFSELYAGVEVELYESNSHDLRRLLLSEDIDLLVAHRFDPLLYTSYELLDERLLLAVPESFEINKRMKRFAFNADEIKNNIHLDINKAVDLSYFADELFLILKKGNDMNVRALSLCAAAGFEPQTRIFLDQLITSYNLACAGMGIAFISDVLVRSAFGRGCVYYLLEGEEAHRKMYVGCKKNKYITNACRAFIDTACEVYAPFRADGNT